VERAYRAAAAEAHWPNPLISAAAAGTSSVTNESTGVKMLGPYAWVAPSYWRAPEALASYGGASGFAAEISPGGSPLTLKSWRKTAAGDAAWCGAAGGSESPVWDYHCGNQHGVLKSLGGVIFNAPLEARYGGATAAAAAGNRGIAGWAGDNQGLGDGDECGGSPRRELELFAALAQVAAYESHRAMFEAYSGSKYEATGVIQWMLNNGLPQHIRDLFEWFLVGGGAY
jgi:exo-1,4-beta-D-glucosaminidase